MKDELFADLHAGSRKVNNASMEQHVPAKLTAV